MPSQQTTFTIPLILDAAKLKTLAFSLTDENIAIAVL